MAGRADNRRNMLDALLDSKRVTDRISSEQHRQRLQEDSVRDALAAQDLCDAEAFESAEIDDLLRVTGITAGLARTLKLAFPGLCCAAHSLGSLNWTSSSCSLLLLRSSCTSQQQTFVHVHPPHYVPLLWAININCATALCYWGACGKVRLLGIL
jgi:hypothetical protein